MSDDFNVNDELYVKVDSRTGEKWVPCKIKQINNNNTYDVTILGMNSVKTNVQNSDLSRNPPSVTGDDMRRQALEKERMDLEQSIAQAEERIESSRRDGSAPYYNGLIGKRRYEEEKRRLVEIKSMLGYRGGKKRKSMRKRMKKSRKSRRR